jgi:hypothetical protein
MPPGYETRHAGDYRCLDCLMEIILTEDVTEPKQAKLANYMMTGDSLCSEHAKKRLRAGLGDVTARQATIMLADPSVTAPEALRRVQEGG